MDWNLLIIGGFLLRVIYHLTNERYPFWFNTPEGIANLKKAFFSFIVICLVTYLSYYYHADDKYQDGYQLLVVWGIYVTVGWAIDSIFLAIVSFIEQKILSKFKT